MNDTRQKPDPPPGFSTPQAMLQANLDSIPDSKGVHVVWDHDGYPLYVGYTGQQRTRLRQHLTGDRGASILHQKVGRKLDKDLGRKASRDEIQSYLANCQFAWRDSDQPEQLKAALMRELAPRFNEIIPGQEGGGLWDEFIDWTRRLVEWDGFDAGERDYKLEIARKLRTARDALLSGNPEWVADLKRAFGRPNNLTFYIAHNKFLTWIEAHEPNARALLTALWTDGLSEQDRVRGFFDSLPQEAAAQPGNRVNIGSFLMMALDPTRDAPFKFSLYRKAFELTGTDPPSDPSNDAAVYAHAMKFLDEVVEQARARKVSLRDRLDAQSAMWAVLKGSTLEESMSPNELDRLRRYRGEPQACWWVNQGATYDAERKGSFVWAPQKTKDGKSLAHHGNVRKILPGDVVVHYAKGYIRALGLAAGAGTESPRPGNLPGDRWEKPGYLAEVDYFELSAPIALEDIPVDRRVEHGTPFTKQGAVAQLYMSKLSASFADLLRSQFEARWPAGSPWSSTPSQVWLFQANPDQWNLEEWLAQNELGSGTTWTVTRYKDEIRSGDPVVLWSSGSRAGIYALAAVTGPPELAEREEFRPQSPDVGNEEWQVPLRLTRVLEKPLLKQQLTSHDLLKDLAVIRAPQGTNFRVAPQEWEELRAMLGDATDPKETLADLVRRFRQETGYPRPRDKRKIQERAKLAEVLTPDALAEPQADSFRRLAGPAGGSPGPQPMFNALLHDDEGVEKVSRAAKHLVCGEGDLPDRFNAVMSGELAQRGMKEAVLTKMLAVAFPTEWVPAYVTRGKNGKRQMLKVLGLPAPPTDLTPGHEAEETNRCLRDPLRPYFHDDTWGMLQLGWWALSHAPGNGRENVEQLAARLYLNAEFIREIEKLLRDKRQVIFYGPPGTGKTYVARELAAFFAANAEAVLKVQFHPSYSYEDFVEGFRPQVGGGNGGFRLVDGPLKRITKRAQSNPGTHVLVIDEINRGNVAKVLGELYYLLEYRDEEITLQYSDEPFSLPEDLWVIGTMNTADRSIALVDAALRRRFHFVPFFPDEAPIKGLLRRWLQAKRPEMLWVADLLDKANRELGDRHMAIGPSHFLRDDLTEQWVETIWKYSVLPYIEEQHFGEPGEVERFQLERLRAGGSPEEMLDTPEIDDDPADPEGV